jgi:hypothetical protein
MRRLAAQRSSVLRRHFGELAMKLDPQANAEDVPLFAEPAGLGLPWHL